MGAAEAALTDPFATLNAEQRAAVEHDAAPLLVIAGAGSGKTTTLAARVARLVRDGADPQRVLLLTFSRRAAQEMERRAGQMLLRALRLPAPARPPALPWAGTFHAVGARLLRDYAGRIGLAESFTILDRADAEDLMGIVRQELGCAATKERFPTKATCVGIYSRSVNSGRPLEDVLQTQYPWCVNWRDALKRLFAGYVTEKQRQQVLDYDDLLLYWAGLMTDPALARHVGARFDHVLVDEYQDTNRLQARILLALKPDGRGVTVVGDDAQAIYGFRAADVRNILDFPTQFGAAAKVIALERNYRSTQPILDASNALIARAVERHAKQLWTDQQSNERPWLVSVTDDVGQARWVADRVLERREAGLRLKSQAVLFRTSHHSAPLELELARRNIPFVKFGGLKFLEAAHIKDVLGVLRWAQNPRARTAGFRVAQLVAGVGPATTRRLLDAMDAAAAPAQALLDFVPPPAAAGAWADFAALYRALISTAAAGPSSSWPADLDLVRRWYAPVLQRLHDDAAVREQDLDQLVRLAAGAGSRERFITELTLDPPDATSDEAGPPHRDDDFLILSTIHSAKGQEWQAVYVLNVVDGCIPADLGAGTSAELEEERRLLYVAMTRARHHLALLVPQRFYVTQQQRLGDRHVYGTMSRFIAAEVARTFDRIDAAAGQGEPAAAVGIGSLPQVDVGAALRAAWQ